MPYKKRNIFAKRRRNRRYAAPRLRKRFIKRRAPIYHYKIRCAGDNLDGGYVNGAGWTASRSISQSASTAQNFGFEFRATDIPDWALYQSMYDQYRINKIVFRLDPQCNVNQIGSYTTSGTTNGTITSSTCAMVVDYDNGSTTMSALSEYEQYQNVKLRNVIKPMVASFVPACNIGAVLSGGTLSGAFVKRKAWIGTDKDTVSFHGVKFYIPLGFATPALQHWNVSACFYVSFRNKK